MRERCTGGGDEDRLARVGNALLHQTAVTCDDVKALGTIRIAMGNRRISPL